MQEESRMDKEDKQQRDEEASTEGTNLDEAGSDGQTLDGPSLDGPGPDGPPPEDDTSEDDSIEEDPDRFELSEEDGVGEDPFELPPEGTDISEQKDVYEDKFLRLYAEFENYKKRVIKDKESLVKFANESLIYDLLPSMDNLEIALRHAGENESRDVVEGVKITIREFFRILEKYGVKPIEAEGRPFDPAVHHAMNQVERDDLPENMVVEEFRKGYTYGDKVLRASMVSVSKAPDSRGEQEAGAEGPSDEEA